MSKIVSVVLMAALLAVSSLAFAAEQKIVATVDQIVVQDGAVNVTLKDSKGASIQVFVKDSLTVDKLKDKKIVIGDEVRVKYDDASQVTRLFVKTAGC